MPTLQATRQGSRPCGPHARCTREAAMNPTTQPKLTDEQVLAAMDDAYSWLNCVTPGAKLRQARTAVAGIIAEKDALTAEVRRLKNVGGGADRLSALTSPSPAETTNCQPVSSSLVVPASAGNGVK